MAGKTPGKLIVMCRHAHRNASGRLDGKGIEQSHALGKKLRSLVSARGVKCACIITSSLDRASETGAIVAGYLHTPYCLKDSRLDEYYPFDSDGHLKVLMVLWHAVSMSSADETVVLITHSCVLFRCARLFGRVPSKQALASMVLYEFPLGKPTLPLTRESYDTFEEYSNAVWSKDDSGSGVSGWYCETGVDFAKRADWVDRMVGFVDTMWDDAPVPEVGPSRVFLDSKEWLVKTDIWAMKKWGVRSKIIMAIAKTMMVGGKGTVLRCLRDLLPEHLPALRELDGMYPDEKWVKYIMYPPFVWRLHVHIQGRDAPLPYKNVYLLKDVIDGLELGTGSQEYLVWAH
jgi:phosphohistidine phosphatase SixA